MKRFWGILGRYALVWLVYVLALLLATSIFPGLYFDTTSRTWWVVALSVPVEFAALMILLRPLMLFLTLPRLRSSVVTGSQLGPALATVSTGAASVSP